MTPSNPPAFIESSGPGAQMDSIRKKNISTMPPSCHPTWHLNHLHPIVSNEQKNHRQRESEGRKSRKRASRCQKKKPGESGREIHFVFRLNTDFITGLKHITLKAKSNIKNDRRYKYGEWAGVTEGGGAGGLSATICQSELETIRGDWKGRWLLLSSGAASKLPQMWPCI